MMYLRGVLEGRWVKAGVPPAVLQQTSAKPNVAKAKALNRRKS